MTHSNKCNIHHITCHEGPEGDQRYTSTLSFTWALNGVGGQRHAPATLPLGIRPSTLSIGGWMGPRVSLDGSRKFCSLQYSILDRPAHSQSLYQPTTYSSTRFQRIGGSPPHYFKLCFIWIKIPNCAQMLTHGRVFTFINISCTSFVSTPIFHMS